MQKANRTHNYFKAKTSPRHIILKLSEVNDKEKILKASRGKKTVTCKVSPIRLSSDFSGQERME